MNQEFNGDFFTDAVNSSAYDEPIENSLYGLTFGLGLGDNLIYKFVCQFRYLVLKLEIWMTRVFLRE